MLEVAIFIAGFALAYAANWREAERLRGDARKAEARAEHAQALLVRREAPVEEQWWQADQAGPADPEIPEDALWDESGLFWTSSSASE